MFLVVRDEPTVQAGRSFDFFYLCGLRGKGGSLIPGPGVCLDSRI